MTYDQWKTTDPADCAPACERCGGNLRGFLQNECDDCAAEFLAEEQMLDFYQWEPSHEHVFLDAGPLARSRHTASTSLLQAERSVRELRRRKKKARPGMKNELALRLKDAVTKALVYASAHKAEIYAGADKAHSAAERAPIDQPRLTAIAALIGYLCRPLLRWSLEVRT